MASNDVCAEYLENRMEDLQYETKMLHTVIDKYVEHVMANVTTCLYYKGERGPNYKESISSLDRCLTYILRKSGETTAELTTEKAGGAAVSSSTSPPESAFSILRWFERVEYLEKDWNTMSFVKEELDEVKNELNEVKDEMKAMSKRARECDESNTKFEDKITTLTAGVDDLSEIQSSQQENEVNRNKGSGRMRKNEEEISKEESRLNEIEDQMNDMSDRLKKSIMVMRLASKEKLITKEARSKKTEKHMTELDKKLKGMDAERKKDVNKLRKKLNQCEEKRRKDSIKLEELESQVKQEEEERRTEKVKDRETLMKFENRLNSQENKEKRDTESENLNNVSDRICNIEREKKEVMERVRTLEEKVAQRELDHVTLEDVTERVNKMEEEQKNDKKDLGGVKSEITLCHSKVDTLEKRLHPAIGFTAFLPDKPGPIGFLPGFLGGLSLTCDTVVKGFSDIVSNNGNHYSPTTGLFTAPVDGMYVVALTHMQWGPKNVLLRVVCERVNPSPGGEREEEVCETWTCQANTSNSSICVVNLTQGDRLYVKSHKDGRIRDPSGFSCFLIG